MTSIEYLFNELWETPKDKLTWHSILNKSKEMHKQEIIDAQSYAISNADMTNNKGYFDCDKYYQETFVSKGSDEHIVETNEMVEDDVEKLKYKYFKNEGFMEGYDYAKETLYTEEQVKEAYFKGATDVHDKCTDRTWRGVETKVDIELLKKLNAEYIQSLKQPKKD